MLNRLQLFRNVGQFDLVSAGAAIALLRLVLGYAENGRGKTTLAAIFRSLATGDPLPITERRRLAAPNPPHVVIDCTGGPPSAIFQNGAWNRTVPDIVIFDDIFVDQNICSGLVVESEHRQHLHELILGSRGVALNQQFQQLVARIEEHNRALRERADAVPVNIRGGLSVDDFCALPQRADVKEAIREAERALAAANERGSIRTTLEFPTVSLPPIDVSALRGLMTRDLPDLDRAAAERVQNHIAMLGDGGEAWVASGVERILGGAAEPQGKPCPFCAQDLAGSVRAMSVLLSTGPELSYAERGARMQSAALAGLNQNGARAAISGNRVQRKIGGKQILFVVNAVPDAMSVAAAREIVGQPHLSDHALYDNLKKPRGGPVHLIACHKSVTEAQARTMLGFPDATVVSAPFGIYVVDPVQSIQLVLVAQCRDKTSTQLGVQRFLEWLDELEQAAALVRHAAKRKTVIGALAGK